MCVCLYVQWGCGTLVLVSCEANEYLTILVGCNTDTISLYFMKGIVRLTNIMAEPSVRMPASCVV